MEELPVTAEAGPWLTSTVVPSCRSRRKTSVLPPFPSTKPSTIWGEALTKATKRPSALITASVADSKGVSESRLGCGRDTRLTVFCLASVGAAQPARRSRPRAAKAASPFVGRAEGMAWKPLG